VNISLWGIGPLGLGFDVYQRSATRKILNPLERPHPCRTPQGEAYVDILLTSPYTCNVRIENARRRKDPVVTEDLLYSFPPPAGPDVCEWPGTALGISNTITRTKTRTALHNKTVDASPGLLEKLLNCAHEHLNRSDARESVCQHDVIIHGIRVRALANSPHLLDFWRDNWYSPEEWEAATGRSSATEPQVNVYALQGVANEPEAAYYSRSKSTIIFFNTSYYGQLKSWVLGAVGRILAAEYGIHSIHGACVVKDGNGVLYIAPTGTGKSTSSYGLMTYPKTRFHSDDWVYVRYTYATRGGPRVLVLSAEGSDGSKARGYQVYRWIENHQDDCGARLAAITLDHRACNLTLGDLDLTRPIEAYAYTSEKVFYLRTNLVENFPLAACEILAAKEENVPDVTGAFFRGHAAMLQNLIGDLRDIRDGCLCPVLRNKSENELAHIFARLIAFDNARSMLDIAKVLPIDRVYTNPMEPAKLAAVMLLKRDPDDPTVLAHLPLDKFMERLLIGETPDKKRETAYNAYRAVDDKAERSFIEAREKEAGPSAGRSLYNLFAAAGDVPESLQEEFELFRVMHQAARCYELNTTLQKDPAVSNKREAVALSMQIIARTLDEQPRDVLLTIDNYRNFLR
jgi:hypothetical protein